VEIYTKEMFRNLIYLNIQTFSFYIQRSGILMGSRKVNLFVQDRDKWWYLAKRH
jgi:hypothetical protein